MERSFKAPAVAEPAFSYDCPARHRVRLDGGHDGLFDLKNKVTGGAATVRVNVPTAQRGAQDLKEGETYNWEGVMELPTNSNPTLRGSIIDHTWEIQAGLDMPGNDPDSGWQSFDVT